MSSNDRAKGVKGLPLEVLQMKAELEAGKPLSADALVLASILNDAIPWKANNLAVLNAKQNSQGCGSSFLHSCMLAVLHNWYAGSALWPALEIFVQGTP